jgi:hypothetical protein
MQRGAVRLWQGASIAAVLCALQQQGALVDQHSSTLPLRFAILCSGYISPAEEHKRLHAAVGSICLPSLHVYGMGGEDRQVSLTESRALRELFDARCAHIIEHQAGHYVPGNKTMSASFMAFLHHFLL